MSQPASAAAKGKKLPVGVQLWSVRDDCKKDLAGTLAALGKLGFDGVEWAGYYDHKAAELKKMLDDSGLKCCGTHIGLDTLLGDKFEPTVEFNMTLGNKYLIVPSLPHERMATLEALTDTAKIFTELAAKAKPLGMRVGYHAHAGDLKKLDDTTPWDVIFTKAGPDVVMQLDTANCLQGGGDPVAILKRYPHRTATIHIKDFGGKQEKPLLGEGDVPLKQVFEICETTGGTEWYILEQEVYPVPPLEAVKACLATFRRVHG